MSEDYEDENKKFIEEIPELIEELYPNCNRARIKEVLARLSYVDDFDKEMYLQDIKFKTGIGITVLRKFLKSAEKQLTEDPFWLEIYKEVNAKYDKKIVSMNDSRQLMLKRGNIYTPDISKFTEYLSEVCENYKTGYRNVRNDVLEKFKDSHLFNRENFCREAFVVNFQNGYYDIIKNEFVKSKNSKKTFFYEIPHEYREGSYGCPKFNEALKKWLGIGNVVTPKDMFQFIGYTMSMNVGLKKAFMLYGESNSGKTQFKQILTYIIGNDNSEDISLQTLEKDQFSSASLEWKILNYHDDLPETKLGDVSVFKVIVGGGSTFPVRRMHTEPYQGLNTVKLWYNTNNVPLTRATQDQSFFNRWCLINFPNIFTPDNKDPNYVDIPYFYKTITEDEEEVQGIIHYAIRGLRLLYKNKHFRKEVYTNTRKVWMYESDLLYAFLDKYTEQDDDEYILCTKFRKWYNVYRKTRKPSRQKPGVTAQELNKDMIVRGYDYKPESLERGKRVYKGLKFNKLFKKDKKNNFQEKHYKTREDYIKDHPNWLNGKDEPEEQDDADFGEFHFTYKN